MLLTQRWAPAAIYAEHARFAGLTSAGLSGDVGGNRPAAHVAHLSPAAHIAQFVDSFKPEVVADELITINSDEVGSGWDEGEKGVDREEGEKGVDREEGGKGVDKEEGEKGVDRAKGEKGVDKEEGGKGVDRKEGEKGVDRVEVWPGGGEQEALGRRETGERAKGAEGRAGCRSAGRWW